MTANNITTGFSLAGRLEADTIPVMDLRLCSARLMNDSRYPWIVLVPRVASVTEIYDLNQAEQSFLMEEMSVTARAMAAVSNPVKMNIGSLGNLVPQLHVHIIARFEDDAAWPDPVWGRGESRKYSDNGNAYLSLLRPQVMQEMTGK